MDVVKKSYFLQSRYPMRCSGDPSHLTSFNLLITVPVLSAVMDTTIPTLKHGIRAPLVSALSILCGIPPFSRVLTRYDLRVLFNKAHGEFSVNVQAISRVCHVSLWFCHTILMMLLIGCEPSQDFPLGP